MNYESNCCGAPIILIDICNACGEHCEAIDNTEEEIEGEDDEILEDTTSMEEKIDLTATWGKEQLLND